MKNNTKFAINHKPPVHFDKPVETFLDPLSERERLHQARNIKLMPRCDRALPVLRGTLRNAFLA